MATEKERQEFIAQFTQALAGKPGPHGWEVHRIGDCIHAARALLRHARTHGNLAVQYRNGPQHLNGPSPYNWQIQPEQHREWINGNRRAWEAWEARRERKEQACERRIKEICAGFSLPVTLGGDPRGYTVKVKFPSGAYNTWGGSSEGYGIPS